MAGRSIDRVGQALAKPHCAVAFVVLWAIAPAAAAVHEAASPDFVEGKVVAHWSGLPIWGVEAKERGFEIPEPFGISANFYWDKQPFAVESVKVGTLSGSLVGVPSFVSVSDADTEQFSFTTRYDVWVFPFLNVYGILGYADGRADIKVSIPAVPLIGFPGRNLDVTLDYDGLVYGGGMTLAGGFAPFEGRDTIIFAVADGNYTFTDLEFKTAGIETDTVIETFVFGARLGVRDVLLEESAVGKIHGAVWVGAMYQDVSEELAGRIPASNFRFVIEQQSTEPWNVVVGARLEIGKNFEFMIEGGFGQRESVLVGGTFRF